MRALACLLLHGWLSDLEQWRNIRASKSCARAQLLVCSRESIQRQRLEVGEPNFPLRDFCKELMGKFALNHTTKLPLNHTYIIAACYTAVRYLRY